MEMHLGGKFEILQSVSTKKLESHPYDMADSEVRLHF